jgi:hypothetical protein
MIAEYASPYNITPTQDGGIALVNKRTGRVVFMLSATRLQNCKRHGMICADGWIASTPRQGWTPSALWALIRAALTGTLCAGNGWG